MLPQLTCSQTLAPALSFPVIEQSICPILSNLVSDNIPNIRFNVAKSYAVLVDVLKRLPDSEETIYSLDKEGKTGEGSAQGEALIKNEVMPNLEKLMADQDCDVRFFAELAAKGYNDRMQT